MRVSVTTDLLSKGFIANQFVRFIDASAVVVKNLQRIIDRVVYKFNDQAVLFPGHSSIMCIWKERGI